MNAQMQALMRQLLDSGDITPMGARIIRKVVDPEGDGDGNDDK